MPPLKCSPWTKAVACLKISVRETRSDILLWCWANIAPKDLLTVETVHTANVQPVET